jgi:transcriptional/translational regulatory protein YebC/TACO1
MEGKDIIENPLLIIIIREISTNLIEIDNKEIQEEIIEKGEIEIIIKYNILHSISRFLQEKILKIISQIGLIDLN